MDLDCPNVKFALNIRVFNIKSEPNSSTTFIHQLHMPIVVHPLYKNNTITRNKDKKTQHPHFSISVVLRALMDRGAKGCLKWWCVLRGTLNRLPEGRS